tara:strand:+ start:329 stop:448 length:120 start_codon:yes stop_codon:yes gene_type:complete
MEEQEQMEGQVLELVAVVEQEQWGQVLLQEIQVEQVEQV